MAKSINQYVGKEVSWAQPNALELAYVLSGSEGVIGRLYFRKAFGTYATAVSADGCWTFKRIGFLSPEVTIRKCESDEEIGIFRHNTWSDGGTLEFGDGRRLMANTNFWRSEFVIKTDTDHKLLHYYHGGDLRLSSKVKIFPKSSLFPELPWVMLFGWYLIVLLRRDSKKPAS